MTRGTAKKAKTAKQSLARADGRDVEVSLADKAYGRIEELIVTLVLKPGLVISEEQLSRRLGIGRTPVREALQRLATERLVVIMPRRGIFVAEVNVATQLRLCEARREVERLIARGAARRALPAERTRLAQIAEQMERAGEQNDGKSFLRLDREFNALMVAAARNEFATDAIRLVGGLARRFWYIHYQEVADLPKAALLHANIARATAAGDPEGAARASDALMDYIEDFTRSTLDTMIST